MSKKILAIILALVMCLSLLPVTAAAASQEAVVYVDTTNGGTAEVNEYTVVADNTTTWETGFYVVQGNVNITGNITLNGNVSLILCDGANLNINGQIIGNGKELTIYGQTDDSGLLNVACESNADAVYGLNAEAVTVHGGMIDIHVNNLNGATGNACAICANKAVDILGGSVTANAERTPPVEEEYAFFSAGTANGDEEDHYSRGIFAGVINIRNGSVIATGKGQATGNSAIYSNNTITITDGKVMASAANSGKDNAAIYCGGDMTITDSRVIADSIGSIDEYEKQIYDFFDGFTINSNYEDLKPLYSTENCGIRVKGNLEINSSEVTANGEFKAEGLSLSDEASEGEGEAKIRKIIYFGGCGTGLHVEKDIIFNSSLVTVSGIGHGTTGETKKDAADETIEGSSVKGDLFSCGIRCDNGNIIANDADLVVSGNGSDDGSGDNDHGYGIMIFDNNSVTFNGGSAAIQGEDGYSTENGEMPISYGIYATSTEIAATPQINITSGGSVAITGSAAATNVKPTIDDAPNGTERYLEVNGGKYEDTPETINYALATSLAVQYQKNIPANAKYLERSEKSLKGIEIAVPAVSETVHIVKSTVNDVEWTEGTYVVTGDTVIMGNVFLQDGEVKLILLDDATLTVLGRVTIQQMEVYVDNSPGLCMDNHFFVYGQEKNSGILHIWHEGNPHMNGVLNTHWMTMSGGTVAAGTNDERFGIDFSYDPNGEKKGGFILYDGSMTGIALGENLLCGISFGDVTKVYGGKLTGIGGSNKTTVSSVIVGINFNCAVFVTGGELTGLAYNLNNRAVGIYIRDEYIDSKLLTVNGGHVTGIGNGNGATGIYVRSGITIKNGEIKAIANGYRDDCNGIESGAIEISDNSRVTAVANCVKGLSKGINTNTYAYEVIDKETQEEVVKVGLGDVTVSGNSKLTARGIGGKMGCGILFFGQNDEESSYMLLPKVTVTGGSVTTTGIGSGNEAEGYGLYGYVADNFEGTTIPAEVNVTGGKLTAAGSKQALSENIKEISEISLVAGKEMNGEDAKKFNGTLEELIKDGYQYAEITAGNSDCALLRLLRAALVTKLTVCTLVCGVTSFARMTARIAAAENATIGAATRAMWAAAHMAWLANAWHLWH